MKDSSMEIPAGKIVVKDIVLEGSGTDRFSLGYGSKLTLRMLGKGSFNRNVIIELNGEGSSVEIKKLILGKDDDKMKIDVKIIHSASTTTSNIDSRCVMRDSSVIDFNGFIEMRPNSTGSVGNQSMKAILMSEKSQAKFVPSLKIDTNDVRVGHSSSIGRISDETLFYLMSRGLTKEQATEKVVEGFMEPIGVLND